MSYKQLAKPETGFEWASFWSNATVSRKSDLILAIPKRREIIVYSKIMQHTKVKQTFINEEAWENVLRNYEQYAENIRQQWEERLRVRVQAIWKYAYSTELSARARGRAPLFFLL